MKEEKAKSRLSCLALIIIDYSVEGASEYLASHLFYTHTPGERGLKGPSRMVFLVWLYSIEEGFI